MIKPEFLEKLKASEEVSQKKGRAVYLMKQSAGPKRSRKEIDEVKAIEEMIKKDKQGAYIQFKQLLEGKELDGAEVNPNMSMSRLMPAD